MTRDQKKTYPEWQGASTIGVGLRSLEVFAEYRDALQSNSLMRGTRFTEPLSERRFAPR